MAGSYEDSSLMEDSSLNEAGTESRQGISGQNVLNRGSDPKSLPKGTSRSAHTSNRDDVSSRDMYEQNLRQELVNVRRVNEAIEGVLQNLDKAKKNMKSVGQTVNTASSLLNIWTRILSQTEHNQRLILDPSWHGTSQDIQTMEEEAIAAQQAAERKEAEEQERKANAQRKAEEDERKRAESATKPRATGKSRVGIGRSGSTRIAASANTSTIGTSRGASSTRRTGSGGRGTRGVRSRGP